MYFMYILTSKFLYVKCIFCLSCIFMFCISFV
nr:MAG TPA: hypothetical protein [Caudoviricetes sp.]